MKSEPMTTLTIRLPRQLKDEAEQAARVADRSLAQITREAFRRFINQRKAVSARIER